MTLMSRPAAANLAIDSALKFIDCSKATTSAAPARYVAGRRARQATRAGRPTAQLLWNAPLCSDTPVIVVSADSAVDTDAY